MDVRTAGGDGPRVVWIHGLGEAARCFDRIVAHPQLAACAHQLVDLPGYGRSPWGAVDSIDATIDRLCRWLRGGPPAIVVGHSLGGVIATLCGERAPGPVRAVVDVEGNGSLGDCTFSSQVATYREDDFASHGRDALWASLDASDPALRGYAAAIGFCDPRQMWRHAVDLVELSRGEQLAARRAALAVPLTFIAGAPRGICARSRVLLFEAGVPIVDVGPAGHWPFIDAPDAFADAVAAAIADKA